MAEVQRIITTPSTGSEPIALTNVAWNGSNADIQPVTQRDPITGTGQTITAAGAAKVDGSGVTQPISGNVGVTSLPSIPAGSNVIGHVVVDSAPAAVGPGYNSTGTGQFVPVADSSVAINCAAASSQTLIAAVAGKRILVCAYGVVSNGTGTIQFQDSSGTALTGAMAVTPETGISAGSGYGMVFTVASGKGLVVVTTKATGATDAGATAQGVLSYTQAA